MRLYPTESVKYLGVKIDTNLTWQHHFSDLSFKLNRANALLFKMRKYVCLKILTFIYFAIFDSYLSYCYLAWAQNFSTIQKILILPKRLLELLISNNISIPVPFKQNSILKFQDKIFLENNPFVCKSLNNLSPSNFNTWFSFSSDQHNYETSSSTQGNLMKRFYKTNRYGKYSITVSAVKSWNKNLNLLKDLSPNKIKTVVN